jgi:hypothetical protein
MRILVGLLCLLFASKVIGQNTESLPFRRVNSRFDVMMGTLFYDVLDQNGNTVQRIEQFYPLPPVAVCNNTIWGNVQNDLN